MSAMLSGVMDTCVAMSGVVCVAGALVCVVLYHRHVFFRVRRDFDLSTCVSAGWGKNSYFTLTSG